MMKRTKPIIISAVIAVVIALSVVALYKYDTTATTGIHTALVPYDLNQLSEQSDVIILGTVKNIEQPITNQTEKITRTFTKVNLEIEQELTGNYQNNEIQVTLLGDGKQSVDGQPSLTSGERVVLFLSHTTKDTVFGDTYVPLGGFQAKFYIDTNRIAHNEKHGDVPEQTLIDQIHEARSRS